MISRRMLLAGLGACAVSAAAAREPAAADEVYDVVVAGGGGAGLAAAVSAAQHGASVCLIEKLPMLGGDTLRSTGYFSCVEPRRQTAQGIEDSLELHFLQTVQAGGSLGDPKVIERMVREAPETVAWLERCGVLFHETVYEIYGAGHRRCLKPVLPRGSAYVRALAKTAAELNVRTKLETALTGIDFDAAGRAVGVTVRNAAGVTFPIAARKGVVLACGGFGANAAKIARYAPVLAGLPTDNSPGSTGDALALARRYGIALKGLEYVECVAGNPPGHKTHARLFLPADFVMVNEYGERFVEEDALRSELTEAILRQPNRRCFTVFDMQGVEHLDPISQKGLYQALVADEALRADTLEELAELMRVHADRFRREVGRYNERSGARGSVENKCTRIGCTPLKEAPFWAYEVGLTIHYTPGGIVVDEFGRVLTEKGDVVQGLWAAGEVTGSVHGANRLGGNGLADAFTFGRLTGAAAAQNG